MIYKDEKVITPYFNNKKIICAYYNGHKINIYLNKLDNTDFANRSIETKYKK